jgi:hypothetical protein
MRLATNEFVNEPSHFAKVTFSIDLTQHLAETVRRVHAATRERIWLLLIP